LSLLPKQSANDDNLITISLKETGQSYGLQGRWEDLLFLQTVGVDTNCKHPSASTTPVAFRLRDLLAAAPACLCKETRRRGKGAHG